MIVIRFFSLRMTSTRFHVDHANPTIFESRLIFAGTFIMAAMHIWRTRGSSPSKPQMAAYANA